MTATRLEPSQRVAVELPDFGRVDGRVLVHSEDRIALELELPSGSDLDLAAEREGTLEFTSRRGLHRAHGTVWAEVAASRIVTFVQRLEPAVVQRRDFARVRAVVPVRLWPDAGDLDGIAAVAPLAANTVDVSGNGMLLHRADRLWEGDTFWFELDLPDDDPPLEGRGRVVRVTERELRGARIEGIAEKGRDRLVRFVFECQRRERMPAGWGAR